MTPLAVVFLAVSATVAAVDWWSVAQHRGTGYLARLLVTVALIGLALAVAASDDSARGLVVAALGASLVGDAVTVTPDGAPSAGLAAYLIARLLYGAALVDAGRSGSLEIVDGAALVAGAGAALLLVSDSLGAWTRSGTPVEGRDTTPEPVPLARRVTSHLGQTGLVLWLAV